MSMGSEMRKTIEKGEMGVIVFNKVPKALRCYLCEEDNGFTSSVEMYICSTQAEAEQADLVIWKCPKCAKTKVEKVMAGDGGRFYFLAKKAGMVHVK
jgi:Zn finger protein HypA/HybF involved in hydrogenase expression